MTNDEMCNTGHASSTGISGRDFYQTIPLKPVLEAGGAGPIQLNAKS